MKTGNSFLNLSILARMRLDNLADLSITFAFFFTSGMMGILGVALAFIMTVTLLPPLLRYVKRDKKD